MAQEERLSGINPLEPTELDMAVQDIVDRTAEAQEYLAKGDETWLLKMTTRQQS